MRRDQLIAMARTLPERVALRNLLLHLRDDELDGWRDRETWRVAGERWRHAASGRTYKTSYRYVRGACAAVGVAVLPMCNYCRQDGHWASQCPNGNGKYCSKCCGLPHRRPQDGPCVCGQYYEEEA